MAQLPITSGNNETKGPIHPVQPSANGKRQLADSRRDVRFASQGRNDTTNLLADDLDPLDELTVGAPQDLTSFLNFEEQDLEEDFAAGLDIPMDDLTQLDIFSSNPPQRRTYTFLPFYAFRTRDEDKDMKMKKMKTDCKLNFQLTSLLLEKELLNNRKQASPKKALESQTLGCHSRRQEKRHGIPDKLYTSQPQDGATSLDWATLAKYCTKIWSDLFLPVPHSISFTICSSFETSSLVGKLLPWLPAAPGFAIFSFSNNSPPKSSSRLRPCINPFKSGRLSISLRNAASALAKLFLLRNSSMTSTLESSIFELQQQGNKTLILQEWSS
ncbi:hypothetical protein Ccrd_016580 [Cynara cardunculus var. scolymus]|uniref:Uncharacterized protein n=1 Tax=Cynara cardunculus var. scolymus TaxID=59895 RepID=A0A103Y9M9_CYNCS|nr:hypothetical protein Ccrd_016580 [Cynara cardunculus var. scolymus]